MGKMFKTITQTWNPFTGCKWDCTYCWARKLAEGKLKKQYPNGFVPEFHENRVNRKFKAGEFVFVSSMGDISFCENLYPEIIGNIEDNPKTNFLLQTKNPAMFVANDFPPNVYTGATIETNRDITVSKAPHPRHRALDMIMNQHPYKFLSIEPVMDFDLEIFSTWIHDISPEIVEIGADNYHNNLTEPSWEKVTRLIDILTLHGVKVVEKDGLRRLKNSTLSVI
jgi:protein gp37